MLAERPCELRDSDHRYVDLTNGTEMVVSVTGDQLVQAAV